MTEEMQKQLLSRLDALAAELGIYVRQAKIDGWEYAVLAEAESQSLRSQIAVVTGERDRQYEFNAGSIVKIAALEQKLATAGEVIGSAIEVLDELEDYFDARADADHNGERYIPNEAMKHLTAVRGLLQKAEELGCVQ